MPERMTKDLEPGNVIEMLVLKERMQFSVMGLKREERGQYTLAVRKFPSESGAATAEVKHIPACKTWALVGQDYQG